MTKAGLTTENLHQIVAVEDNAELRAKGFLCSKSDSTLWSTWAVSQTVVPPSEVKQNHEIKHGESEMLRA